MTERFEHDQWDETCRCRRCDPTLNKVWDERDEAVAALQKIHDMLARPGQHGGSIPGLTSCILDSIASMQINAAEVEAELVRAVSQRTNDD